MLEFAFKEQNNSEKGFTLVEIALVAGLLGMLFLVLWGSLNGIIQAKEVIEQRSEALRTSRYVLERMLREISAMDVTRPFGIPPRFIVAKNKKGARGNLDSLRFTSKSGSQATLDGSSNFGWIEIAYYLKQTKRDSFDISNQTLSYSLIREELPAGSNLPKKVSKKKTVFFPLAENVAGLNFRFFNKNQKRWSDSWDRMPGAPNAVEITLSLLGKDGEVIDYKTAVATLSR